MKAVANNELEVISAQREEFARLATRADGSLSWNGGSWGIQASILYAPARDITVIVLSNASNAGEDTQTIARQLLAAARQ